MRFPRLTIRASRSNTLNSNFLSQIAKPSPQPLSYTLKYQWLARSSEYALLSTTEVQEEQVYLVKELSALKQQLKKCPISISRVSKVSSKPLHRSNQANLSKNQQSELDNNHFNIVKLRNQLELLQRQASPRSNQGVEGKVMETRQKILKIKQKIKDIKHKSRQMGDNLENGRDFFQEAKKLEHERDGILARKNKLQEKVYQSERNLARIVQKLAEIEGDALYADSYLQDWMETKKNQDAQRSFQNEHRQKLYQLQLAKKTMESHKSTKQQKYHQLLKTLQNQIEKKEHLQDKLQKAEIKNLYQKKELMELEDQVNQLNLNHSRTKTSNSLQHFQEVRGHYELPALPHKFNQLASKLRNLSTSRTKTSGHPLDNKNNFTQILHKPPSSDSDIYSVVTQPPPRGNFRTSRNRMMADRTSKTPIRQKSVELVPCIQEQITEQSPEKETIEKNPSMVTQKDEKEQKAKTIKNNKLQEQKGTLEQEGESTELKRTKQQQSQEKITHADKEKINSKENDYSHQQAELQNKGTLYKQQILVKQDDKKGATVNYSEQFANEDEIIAEEVQKTIESNIQQQVEKARKSVCEAQTKMQHNQNIINNYLNCFQTDPAEDQQA